MKNKKFKDIVHGQMVDMESNSKALCYTVITIGITMFIVSLAIILY